MSSFSFFYSLVSRVTSSVRAYLLVMANITIDLSSTYRMIFLLLQKH
jgi:hypothetical protein